MIRNIIFDMGNVLIDLDIRACIDAFAALSNKKQAEASLSPDALMGDGGNTSLHDFELGNISINEYLDGILSVCSPSATREQVRDANFAILSTFPDARRRALLELRNKGYHLILLSNTNALHWPYCLEQFEKPLDYQNTQKKPRMCDFFQHVFLSHEMHLCKPDVRIYKQMLEETNIIPEETLYFDDVEANVLAGRDFGLNALQVMGDEWLPIVEALPILDR